MIRASLAYGKTSGGDVTYVANELVTTDAPAGTVGVRVGATTGLTPPLQLRLAIDAVEKLVELVSKFGLTGYQQVSGVASQGKTGLAVNTNVDLPADTDVGAYTNIGLGLNNSSTNIIKVGLQNCLEVLREQLAAS